MIVSELIELLQKADPNSKVILEKDAEGNGYSPLSEVNLSMCYLPESEWSGQVFDPDWTAVEACMHEEDWEEFIERPRVVVLGPAN